MIINRMIAIHVRYLPWTNHKPSRTRLVNTLNKKHLTFCYDHNFDRDLDAAAKRLIDAGCTIEGCTFDERSKDYTIIMMKDENIEPLERLGLW